MQGYNTQAVATEEQFIVAAEVTNHANDASLFEPLVTTTKRNLRTPARSAVSDVCWPTLATGAPTTSTSPEWNRSSPLVVLAS